MVLIGNVLPLAPVSILSLILSLVLVVLGGFILIIVKTSRLVLDIASQTCTWIMSNVCSASS